MDENPYRSPESSGSRQVQRLPLRGKGLISFFVGGWLTVLAGMLISGFAIGTLLETAERGGAGQVLGTKVAAPLWAFGYLGGTLIGGWLAGRLYRHVYSRVASRSQDCGISGDVGRSGTAAEAKGREPGMFF